MARNITFILKIIYCCFQQWKNVQNRLTVDEVIGKSSTARFFSETQYDEFFLLSWESHRIGFCSDCHGKSYTQLILFLMHFYKIQSI